MDSIFCNFDHIEKENLLGQQALVRVRITLFERDKVYINARLPTSTSIPLNNFAHDEHYTY
ncbi:hypothetical protein A9Q79_03665 [Methylophaga sp. 42_25_T18]|nr:hypothetical protein A9Q79_03665 [Methylophaga sp. 42_25_T18]